MKRIIFFVSLFLTNVLILKGQDNNYKKEIKKLFELTNLSVSFENSIGDMLVIYKKERKEVPQKVWDEIERELKTGILEYFVEVFAPVYMTYLKYEDIKEVVKFYESPSGKNYAKYSPMIMKETTTIAQEWIYKTHQSIGQLLTTKGYKTTF